VSFACGRGKNRTFNKRIKSCPWFLHVELHVPPLRERRDDVLPLARVLLADAALRMNAMERVVALASAPASSAAKPGFDPPYDYTLDATSSLSATLMSHVGPR